jgi:3-deoxy-manno-octulosonate cytidylyltransferase (CMP-KDO synthetase)
MQNFRVVIPARYASMRLPGKPLAEIAGLPMIVHVYRRAVASGAAEVLIATDDDRIAAAASAHGARVEMTAARHQSGTDRIAEVAERLQWRDEDIVVNVQGDEPLIPPAVIEQVANLLAANAEASIATLTTRLAHAGEFVDANTAKVVVDRAGHAMYFSRAPIPHPREGGIPPGVRRHVGLYAYRVDSLRVLASTAVCQLEEIEKLEQLRALWLGMKIVVADACEAPPGGVDTPADLEAVRAQVASRG